jgi:hypothetical protein
VLVRAAQAVLVVPLEQPAEVVQAAALRVPSSRTTQPQSRSRYKTSPSLPIVATRSSMDLLQCFSETISTTTRAD